MVKKKDIKEVEFWLKNSLSSLNNLVHILEHIGFDDGGKVKNHDFVHISNVVDLHGLKINENVRTLVSVWKEKISKK